MQRLTRNILNAFFMTVLFATDVFGAPANCDNIFYRRNHPKQCQEIKSDTDSSTTWMAIAGGVALAGAGIALANKSSGGSDYVPANDTTIARSANIVSNYSLTETVKNKKIYESYLESASKGADIAPETIESIRNSGNYIRNQKQFDAINLAWANARGFSGKNVTVNVLDDFAHYHGDAVHNIVSYIAPDATIYNSYLTTAKNTFKTFDDIANIMRNSAPAQIYNGSWQIDSTQYQNAATVAYNKFNPKTYASAQEYMYSRTSRNFITETINLATDNDSIFVWAAGNDSQKESGLLSAMPLAFPELQGHFVNVVSIDPQTNTLTWYSNQCGITQNYCIAAPGSNLQTDAREAKVTGTSFAAPVVAGAVAVIKEAFPYMKATEITALLFTTAKDLGKPGVDEIYGWGLLDLEAATKPVGTPKIVLSDENIIPLTETKVGGIAGAAIKNSNIKLAFIDDFGRAFTTNLSDNIDVIPYGRAFDKLTEPENNSINLFGNVEFGFAKNHLLESNGLISAKSSNMNTFIGYKNNFNIGDIELYQNARFGMSAPKSDNNSIISGFSDIYTVSIKTGVKYQDFNFEFAIPETIVHGNAYMTLPVARANNGQMIYNSFAVDLTTRPSFEYSIKYKNISAGFIDNADYKDEFYVIAKTKFEF